MTGKRKCRKTKGTVNKKKNVRSKMDKDLHISNWGQRSVFKTNKNQDFKC